MDFDFDQALKWTSVGVHGVLATGGDDASPAFDMTETVFNLSLPNWKRANQFFHVGTNTGGVNITCLIQAAPSFSGPWADIPEAELPRLVTTAPASGQVLLYSVDRERMPLNQTDRRWVRWVARLAGGTSVVKSHFLFFNRLVRMPDTAFLNGFPNRILVSR